ncbi:D-alanyl-D-alanine carboxypeptidase family protein [Clostridium thermarum]|uniref:D-alanyl-D-alanine carboxypeptidase family protein n=1 Tax=Clostridium thermarum TaxID=1716543 RepID=UPI0013CF9175|nr:D-alanyl-D-alanine carboxypeptidase family protein [Clostridium thermarum]
MKKLSFVLSLIMTTMLITMPAEAVTSNELSIDPNCSYILIDSKSGQVLAENNADVKIRPASTTKILTAIVALEEGQLDKEVKVSQEAVFDIGDGGMNIGIMAGETNLTLENMLNVMLVKSANETANIIAENVAPSRAEFIERMNKRAVELGAVNTKFYNTNGMDDTEQFKNHLSTARDMAILARHAMTIPKFREIVKQEYYKELPATNKHKEWPDLRTTNKLLWGNNQYPYGPQEDNNKYTVIGIKTGYTSGAGFNLITAAVSEEGTELIAAVMNVKESNDAVINYTKQLYEYGFENYKTQAFVDKDQVLDTVNVMEAKDDGKLQLVASQSLEATLSIDKNLWNILEEKTIKQDITAPVKQGEVLGTVEYKKDGILLGKVDLIAARGVERSFKASFKETVGNIFHGIFTSWLFRILVIIFVLLMVRKHIRRARYRKRRRRFIESRFK